MKKFIIRIYLIITLIILFLSTFILVFFNISDLKKNERNDILKTLNIIEHLYNTKSECNINYLLESFNIKINIIEKNENTVNLIIDKIYKNKTKNNTLDINNIYENFLYNNKNLYYIKEYDKNIIIIYKKFDIIPIILRDSILCSFITLICAIFIYIILKNYVYKNIILPLQEISQEIPKLKNKNENLKFKTYKFEEINIICKQIKYIENDLKSIGDMLKIEKNKVDYILDNMSEGFVLFDKNKNVFSINKMAKKIFNCNKNNLGENILYYTQNIKLLENIEKVLSTNQKNIFDIKTEDNKTYSIHMSKIQKGIFEKGNSGVIMLMIDVTAERETEKLKQEFFSNVSHELKTPITSIQGYAELLYNDFAISREQEKEFLKIIQKESINITNLINNILTISKLENKEIEINKSDINIKTIVDEIINSTKPMCIEQNITIKNNCDSITMLGDYKKIHQLFNNLIVNAIKYNKNNGYVEINCFKDEKNINIIIKDSGIGIPLVDRNRIFERFYRVEKGRSKSLGGTGLGLSIVKHIVKYYNGKIKVKSTEGFGSEFIIKIPINK
ncbi:sensor histidine kinase [[Clostridium] colinum]|uniref:sensor histidine kinase n=1 Tax=[Clostridium] colinum TaxID=36835 RepID=UPI00202555C7|nr:ATP-binding protein [[Clostridium] colinum]